MASRATKSGRRKAGGEGKKGKVFLENKGSILDLIQDVTSAKEAQIKTKLDKLQPRPDSSKDELEVAEAGRGGQKAPKSQGALPAVTGSKVKKGSKKEGKAGRMTNAETRKEAIEQAKLALMAKDKEKKRKRRAPMATPTTPTAQVKRVGFA